MALSFTTISGDGRHSLAGTTSGFNSEMDDEEIDQLDSGLDDEDDEMEPEVEEESISTAKGRRRLGVRVPGTTLVPQDRLDNILQAEGSGPHMSKEAVYMLSIATEEFVKRLAEAGYQQKSLDKRQHIQYRDMANLPQQLPEFKFLEDTVPKPISIAEAMQRRAAKEREVQQDDPAISSTVPPSPPLLPAQPSSVSVSANTKTKAKIRQSLPAAHTNGKETNGIASASASAAGTPAASTAPSRSRHRDSRGRWSNGPSVNGSHEGTPVSTATGPGSGTRASSARIRNRSTRARESEAAQSHRRASQTNGSTLAQNGHSASGGNDTHESAAAAGQPEPWAIGQIIGPASGYLEEGNRLAVNGRNAMTDNPGRTIYSQQRSPAPPR